MLEHMSPVHAAAAELGIVVVHYRDEAVLATCLQRLAVSAPSAQVVVVDTSGHAAAAAVVTRHVDATRGARVTHLPAPNHSYAHATNVGWKALDAPLLAVMNADTWVEAATFAALEAALASRPAAGLAGPMATDRHGRVQDLGLPYRAHYLRLRWARRADDHPPIGGAGSARTGGAALRAPAAVSVPWLSGCLQLARREVLDAVGGYDPSLRFFNEDWEFCLRARRAGYTCQLVDTPVVHLGGTSTPAHPAFHVEGRRGGYALSRRYATPTVRRAHRAFLWLEAGLGARLARGAAERAAHRRMLAMLRADDFDTSPFLATLNDPRIEREERP
jgi:N-acetylglucosaminyl-diphospho-decaprenol L-rhamnosyltransferase